MRDSRVIPLRPLPEAEAAALSLDDVEVRIARRAVLRGASLNLGGLGITAILGPNGAGKSILIKVLSGLIQIDSGRVKIEPKLTPASLVLQRPVLFRRSTRANLDHALKIAGVPRNNRPGRVAELLVKASLTQQSEVFARSLSAGEQQRLQIVRALAAAPKLLLLDEPTTSLDPASTAVVESMIRQIADDGVKVVIVTHDPAQARRLAHDVAFLHKGQIAEHAPAQAFFARPSSDPAKAYLSGSLLV